MTTTRQEQSTKPSLENEVTILEHNSTPILDHDLPIALRKETCECTKMPLYQLSHFVSFQIFSLNHKSFVMPQKYPRIFYIYNIFLLYV